MPRLTPILIALLLWLASASAQEQTAKPELFQEMDEILAELAKFTGWKAPKKVDSDTITKDGLKQFLEDRMKEIVKPEELHAEELSLKKLGLVPKSFDLRKTTVDLLTEQAAAFYDYRKKKLFVLDTNATLTQKPVLVHELAHALADTQINLEKYIFKGKSDDSSLARQAVMEGQATWLMSEYIMSRMGGSLTKSPEMADVMSRMAGNSSGAFPVFDSVPLYLRESLLFPYTKGFTFQQAVIQKLGKEGFLAVFKNPPLSSQQIIHPEKYFDKVQPTKPPLPKASTRGYTGVVEGTAGEFDHEILFRQYGGEADAKLARKWRGAEFRIFEDKKDRSKSVLLYASDWQDEKAARDVFRLYKKVLQGKANTFELSRESASEMAGTIDGCPFLVRLESTRVTSVEY
ncbi:MAG: ImmA/IrrE family metallo-endopeptidase [Bryobacterales bacterium]|nr:ImmA/IrrE family metallo-endopeptidase [Bryobacterales bacterium]